LIHRRPPLLAAFWIVCATLLVAIGIGPALWLLVIAMQPAGADMTSPLNALDKGMTLDNFRQAWYGGDAAANAQPVLLRPLVNSVLVTIARAVLNVLIAAAAAYPLARMKFRGRGTIFTLILGTMMIPEQVIVVPMFRTIVGMGLYDSLLAVIIPMSVTAFGIYLCRQAFLAIPDEMEEAARIDGAGSVRIWWSVVLPLSAPTLSTLALFSVIGSWSELLWPLIVLQSQEHATLPVALNTLLGQCSTNVRAAYAGAVISLIPVVVVFLVSQKFFRSEMFAGAVKG
jgi:putative chitobiose transport system permease protein